MSSLGMIRVILKAGIAYRHHGLPNIVRLSCLVVGNLSVTAESCKYMKCGKCAPPGRTKHRKRRGTKAFD